MCLYFSFSKHLFHNYVCQVAKGNDPITASEGGKKKKTQTKAKQMFYELLEAGFVTVTGYLSLAWTVPPQLKYKKGLSMASSSRLSEFTDAELINEKQMNQ